MDSPPPLHEGVVMSMCFLDLVEDVQQLVILNLDPPSRASLALTCRGLYQKYFPRELYGIRLCFQCYNYGYIHLLKLFNTNYGCPFRFDNDALLAAIANPSLHTLETLKLFQFSEVNHSLSKESFASLYAAIMSRQNFEELLNMTKGLSGEEVLELPWVAAYVTVSLDSSRAIFESLVRYGCLDMIKFIYEVVERTRVFSEFSKSEIFERFSASFARWRKMDVRDYLPLLVLSVESDNIDVIRFFLERSRKSFIFEKHYLGPTTKETPIENVLVVIIRSFIELLPSLNGSALISWLIERLKKNNKLIEGAYQLKLKNDSFMLKPGYVDQRAHLNWTTFKLLFQHANLLRLQLLETESIVSRVAKSALKYRRPEILSDLASYVSRSTLLMSWVSLLQLEETGFHRSVETFLPIFPSYEERYLSTLMAEYTQCVKILVEKFGTISPSMKDELLLSSTFSRQLGFFRTHLSFGDLELVKFILEKTSYPNLGPLMLKGLIDSLVFGSLHWNPTIASILSYLRENYPLIVDVKKFTPDHFQRSFPAIISTPNSHSFFEYFFEICGEENLAALRKEPLLLLVIKDIKWESFFKLLQEFSLKDAFLSIRILFRRTGIKWSETFTRALSRSIGWQCPPWFHLRLKHFALEMENEFL